MGHLCYCVHGTQLTTLKLHCSSSPLATPSHSESAEREGVGGNEKQLTALFLLPVLLFMTACRKPSMTIGTAVPLPFHHLSWAVQNAPPQYLAVAGRGGWH